MRHGWLAAAIARQLTQLGGDSNRSDMEAAVMFRVHSVEIVVHCGPSISMHRCSHLSPHSDAMSLLPPRSLVE